MLVVFSAISFREFERLKVVCEDSKTQYGELEQKTTKVTEDLKHLANKVGHLYHLLSIIITLSPVVLGKRKNITRC